LRRFPPQHSEPSLRGQHFFPLVLRLVGGLALCQGLAACSVTAPLGVDASPTGSISAPPQKETAKPSLPASLDEEDRRRALGALAIALDPQGNGASVNWDNPVSKAHGKVTPMGYAYPANDLICREFAAQFDTKAGAQAARGSACRDKSAQWSIAALQPAKAE
jgi:surface antigen